MPSVLFAEAHILSMLKYGKSKKVKKWLCNLNIENVANARIGLHDDLCPLCRKALFQRPEPWHTIVIDSNLLITLLFEMWVGASWGEFQPFMGPLSRAKPFIDLLRSLDGETLSLWMLGRMLCDLVLVYDAEELFELVDLEKNIRLFVEMAAGHTHPLGPPTSPFICKPWTRPQPIIRTISYAELNTLMKPEPLDPTEDALTADLIFIIATFIKQHSGTTTTLQYFHSLIMQAVIRHAHDGILAKHIGKLTSPRSREKITLDHLELRTWYWLDYVTRRPVRLAWAAAIEDARERIRAGVLKGEQLVLSYFEATPKAGGGRGGGGVGEGAAQEYRWATPDDGGALPKEGLEFQWTTLESREWDGRNLPTRGRKMGWVGGRVVDLGLSTEEEEMESLRYVQRYDVLRQATKWHSRAAKVLNTAGGGVC
ncbi:MAG: hypothetical protein Q9165_008132 [Trypethelium subeluteriae]